ncbi:MAG: RsmE family RNA methyltransferase [Planctomycetota bacterium]
MNLLLLEPHELGDDGRASLSDRRAQHLREVLGADPGRSVRVGVVGGGIGSAIVESIGAESVVLRVSITTPALPRNDDLLLLAIPRPKVLARTLEHATALGFGHIVLVRAWFSDKSHLDSHALQAEFLRARILAGLEQSERTLPPTVSIEPRFRPFVEDQLRQRVVDHLAVLADPDADIDVATLEPTSSQPIALAIGPERGFNTFEGDLLVAQGFVRAHSGPHPLRVETALTAVYAQLGGLRRRAAFGHGINAACESSRGARTTDTNRSPSPP